MKLAWLSAASAVMFSSLAGSVFGQDAPAPKATAEGSPTVAKESTSATQQDAAEALLAKVAAVVPSEWTVEKINAIPKRDLEFVESSEVSKSASSIYSSYLDARYVAYFMVEIPPKGKVFSDITYLMNRPQPSIFAAEHENTYAVRLVSAANSDAFLGHYFGAKAEFNANRRQPTKVTLKPVLDQVPADTLTQDELAYFSTHRATELFFIHEEQIQRNEDNQIIGPTEPKKASFMVFGDSPEETKQRVLSLLKLIDYGYTRPLQLALASDRQVQLEKLQDLYKQLQQVEKENLALQEENKGIAKLSNEELNVDLQSLKFQAEVEIASCNARLAAYKQKLADLPPDSPRLQQLEGFQTSVEIELIGHQVRAAKIKEQMDKVAAAQSITQRLKDSWQKMGQLRRDISFTIELIQSFDTELRRYAPVKIIDNKIKLSPHKGELLSTRTQQ
ncbi:MAG: hypothetical protein ACO1RA_11985 [Planctomycetaceae bacterium]